MYGKPAIFILDSSFFLSGLSPPKGDLYTVPQVVEEVRSGRKELIFAESLGLRILESSYRAIELVKEESKRTGDITRLSETDIQLLALALDLKGVLLTDDYSMQNTAMSMGIAYEALAQKGIRKLETWYYRCAYCGRYLENSKWEKHRECEICGGPMRSTRRPPETA